MTPTYHYSLSSAMPLDLNHEDHSHQLFSTNHQPTSSSSSLSYSTILFNHQDQGAGSYYWKPKQVQSDDEEGEKYIPSTGSWDNPTVGKEENSSETWKKVDGNNIENLEADEDSCSVKWMPPKMRIKWRMMEDQKVSEHRFEEQKLPLSSPLGIDNNSSNNSNITVRVCADCHTTKTPLWRSGPTGPKTLCNACGIRQRKARRALAAAAAAAATESANDTIDLVAAEKPRVKGNKLQKKGKKSKTESQQLKKKRKFGTKRQGCRGRNKFCLEELIITLSNNLSPQHVFPQDEKEAAILLMTLSHGLLRAFPEDPSLYIT